MDSPLLSVVVPVLNEEANLPELHARLVESLAAQQTEFEVVYVDDGSTDRSAELIESFAGEAGAEIVLVRLSRNFGMEVAMSAGLDHSRGAYVALMHADLQDPPELLPEMLSTAQQGADVVYARRIGRDESAVKRMLATGFYELMRRIARVPYQGQAGDFRVLSRRVVEAVQNMPERRRFLRGMVAWVGFEQVPIEYQRAGRHAGRGASYPALGRLALEAMTAFSDVPLQLATLFGTFTAVLSALGAVVIAGLTLVNVISISVWVWVLIAVLFLSGVQLITVGILGRYLARVHDEVLRRPLYLVDSVDRSASQDPPASQKSARDHVKAGLSRPLGTLVPLALYALLSFVLFGSHIVDHPRGNIVASDEIDASQFMWFFSWWPHALLNGLNPFVTYLMFVPEGFNLQWATSMPLPSVLLSPVTLAAGPAVTWNLIQLASPALSAWTAFLLCRHLTGQLGPSLVGGYVFGFSPYMLAHLTGGPYLALVPMVPLFALFVLRHFQGQMSSRPFRDLHDRGPNGPIPHLHRGSGHCHVVRSHRGAGRVRLVRRAPARALGDLQVVGLGLRCHGGHREPFPLLLLLWRPIPARSHVFQG